MEVLKVVFSEPCDGPLQHKMVKCTVVIRTPMGLYHKESFFSMAMFNDLGISQVAKIAVQCAKKSYRNLK